MLDYLRHRSLILSVGTYSGLGNRLRAVLSAESLAEHEGRRFFYCWPTGHKFGARFDDLWVYGRPTVSRSATRVLAACYPIRRDFDWIESAGDKRIWQIRTGQPVPLPPGATTWTERLRSLRPSPLIAERIVRAFDERLRGRPYVGVMVRAHAHSHETTLETSPVQWFLDRMNEIHELHPDVGFYVSCDVPEVQDHIVAQFSTAWGLPGKSGYNSAGSLPGAVVDLYLLASGIHLLGPHYSSFPELARYLAADRIVLQTPLSGTPLPEVISDFELVSDPLRPEQRSKST